MHLGLAPDDVGPTKAGFHVENLVPGTGVDQKFYLFNNGAGVDLDVSAHVPALPGAPAGGYGFSGFENLTVDISSPDCVGEVVETNMSLLNAGEVALPCADEPLSESATEPREYTAHIDITPAAVSGSHAGVDVFDLVFTGEAAAVVPEP